MNQAPALTIVVPTFNERGNIQPLLEVLHASLEVGDWRIIFVDDNSPDKTSEVIRESQSTFSNVELICRVGRRGLSSACIEGFYAADTPFIAVMDADLQHDESVLPRMLHLLREGSADMVVGTRFDGTGSTGDGLAPRRKFISQSATLLTRLFFRVKISDPMSGFFMMKQEVFCRVSDNLSAVGFKIMMDIVINHRGDLAIAEVPYTMRARHQGTSKLDWLVAVEYVAMLISLKLKKILPPRFIIFAGVGCTGLGVHAATLYLATHINDSAFLINQSLATLVAMTSNFFLNNEVTFRPQKLRGRMVVYGLLSFYVACGMGAIINLAVSQLLYAGNVPFMIAGVAGALIAAIWNYLTTRHSVWR